MAATTPAAASFSITAFPTLRLHTKLPPLRGKMPNTVRASAAHASVPSLPHRDVAWSLAAQAEARMGSRLLPSTVPADVSEFRNAAGGAVGSLDVRRGEPGSSIDFMLQSSLHCKVPNGAIDITTILIFLNGSTDAPHFLLEFIQGSSTSIIVILDLLPRKDLAFHPDYIDTYYENTRLDKQREILEDLPQVSPYRSPSLFVRSATSPAAISVSINCGQGGESILEDIVCGQLAEVAKEILEIWLHNCAHQTTEMEEGERDRMLRRDQIVRVKSIEVDLTANLPRMFGSDVSARVIAEIRKAFGVHSES